MLSTLAPVGESPIPLPKMPSCIFTICNTRASKAPWSHRDKHTGRSQRLRCRFGHRSLHRHLQEASHVRCLCALWSLGFRPFFSTWNQVFWKTNGYPWNGTNRPRNRLSSNCFQNDCQLSLPSQSIRAFPLLRNVAGSGQELRFSR